MVVSSMERFMYLYVPRQHLQCLVGHCEHALQRCALEDHAANGNVRMSQKVIGGGGIVVPQLQKLVTRE